MAGKAPKHPKVHIEADNRRQDEQGRPRLLLRYVLNHKTIKVPLGYVGPEEAEEARADLEAHLRLGITPTSPSSPQLGRPATVGDAVDAYLALLPTMPGKPEHHRWETTRCLHLDRLLGAYALTALTTTRLKGYVSRRKSETNEPRKRGDPNRRRPDGDKPKPLAPQVLTSPRRVTVFNELCCLRRVVKAHHEAGLTAVTTLPRAKDLLAGWEEDHRPPRQLTEADVRALIAAGAYTVTSGTYAGRDRAWTGRLVGFLAWCPRRPVAVFGLRLRDCAKVIEPGIERKARVIWIERDKGGKGRGWSPLTEPALRYLREQIEARIAEGAGPDDLVWRTETGAEWTARTWWRVMQGLAVRAGVEDVTTYDLRKFGAAQVYRRKPNLKVVMQYTGHKNPAVLLKNYLFPDKDEAEEAAEGIGWSASVVRLVSEDER